MKQVLFATLAFLLILTASCSRTPVRKFYTPSPKPAAIAATAAPKPEQKKQEIKDQKNEESDTNNEDSQMVVSKTAAVSPKKKKHPSKEKGVIVIDAGHGGEDFGTHSLGSPKFQEKYLNMSTALMVKSFLQRFGYKVLMTRSDDTFISLENRSLFANEQNPRLFVSIHFNSAPSKEADGIEVFYYRDDGNKGRTAKSKMLAQAILDKTIQNTNAKSRGVKHGNYAVLRETTMASALIEGGFLTNADEMEKIKDAAYLKNLALGIAQGIQSYLSKESVLAEN